MSDRPLIVILLPLLALVGHFSLCIFVINRLHSTGLPRYVLKLGDAIWYLLLVGVPLAGWQELVNLKGLLTSPLLTSAVPRRELAFVAYFAVCLVAALGTLVHRAAYLMGPGRGYALATTGHRTISIARAAGRNPARHLVSYLATRLPLNEVLTLSVTEKTLPVPRLDSALAGITIAHVSDLHLTGQWDQDFYRVVVDEILSLESDVIMITGDIIENSKYLPWVDPLFGRLAAPLGVYFVLGNHEQRIRDESEIRDELTRAGLIDLGGKWLQQVWRERHVLLAGNELPWYSPAADLPSAPTGHALRIALSHAPDQLPWAREHDVDLLLAGHTHGGQVRLPGFGPLLCPSRYGIRYASGVFVDATTVMHVSRGVAGTRPLRYRCPPEITRLTLVASMGD